MLLILSAVGVGGCGDQGATSTSTGSTDGAGGGKPPVAAAGGSSDHGGEVSSRGKDADDAEGSGADSEPEPPPPPPGSEPAPDPGFATELRTIVAESLAELAPLADASAVYGQPAAYAETLKAASGQIDATIARLEELDPPAAAEPGTEALIAAYQDLDRAVDRGASAFASGDAGRINAGRAYLTEKGAAFRTALAAAADSLRSAGIELPGG